MKQKGSVSDYLLHRESAVLQSFKEALGESDAGSRSRDIYAAAALRPAPRFWVSEYRASIVIGAMIKADKMAEIAHKRKKIGLSAIDTINSKRKAMLNKIAFGSRPEEKIISDEPGEEDYIGSEAVLSKMYKERAAMYREIYRRYKELRAAHPDYTILDCVGEIVYTSAPRHYLSAEGLRRIVEKRRRKNVILLRAIGKREGVI